MTTSSITAIPNISSSVTDCHGIIAYKIQEIIMDNVMGIPYFILFMVRDIPTVIYEILARIKNHIDTKSWGYVPS